MPWVVKSGSLLLVVFMSTGLLPVEILVIHMKIVESKKCAATKPDPAQDSYLWKIEVRVFQFSLKTLVLEYQYLPSGDQGMLEIGL